MTDEDEPDEDGRRPDAPAEGGDADASGDEERDAPTADDGDATADDGGAAVDDGAGAATDDGADAATDDRSAATNDRSATSDDAVDPVVVPADAATDDDGGFLSNLVGVREQLGAASEAFRNARGAGALPTDEHGRVRIVCRRHAEHRAVALDVRGRPACYEEGHTDCEGCLEDVRDGTVETW